MGRILATVWALLVLAVAGQACAQGMPPIPPLHTAIDSNGVDLFAHTLSYDMLGVAIGPAGEGRLSATVGSDGQTEYSGAAVVGYGGTSYLNIGKQAVHFSPGTSGGPSFDGSGRIDRVGDYHIYTPADGTAYSFSIHDSWQWLHYGTTNVGVLTKITRPDGATIDVHLIHDPVTNEPRVMSVTNNYGYQIQFGYTSGVLTKMVAFNQSYASCGVTTDAASCSLSGWPQWTASSYTATDPGGRTTYAYRYTYSYSPDYTYANDGRTTSILNWSSGYDDGTLTNALGAWSYHTTSTGVEVTDPLGHVVTYGLDFTKLLVTSYTDPLGRVTTYHYDSFSRPDLITAPDGHKVQYAYDSRGNVLSTTQIAATGSGLSNIVTSATYQSSCTAAADKSCNKPITTTDALGKVTDYTYDSATGHVLTITAPSPGPGLARPQTRYTYNGYLINYLARISTCMTGSAPSCLGTAAETVVTMDGAVPSSVTTASGNGAVSATTSFTYDMLGDLASVDGPLYGGDDKTWMRYDLAQRLVGTVGPDPDGVGPRKPQGSRITYDAAGHVSATAIGTLDGFWNDPATDLAVYQTEYTTYDGLGRLWDVSQVSGAGDTQSHAQYDYGPYGVTCAAQRMNWSALSGTWACAASAAGSDGPDRISKYYYDNAGAQTLVKEGCDNTGACLRDVATTAYSPTTGQATSVTDAKGNTTSYTYDGFGRSKRTTYADSSYEELTYNAYGQVSQIRRRDGSSFSPTYDDLGRMTNSPGGGTIAYDNQDQVLSVGGLTNTYDALGQQLTAVSTLGGTSYTVGYQYDAAGRRTRMDYPGGFYVTYDWDADDNLTAIRLNGGAAIVTYGYDGIGRRVSKTAANGAATTYAYDAASRLANLNFDLPGTNGDRGMELSYNPMGQLRWRSYSNAAFDPALAPSSASTGANSLNQVTGITGLSYNANGAMTGDGVKSYGYDSLNRLTSAGASALTYDDADRLSSTYSSGTGTTRFLYDGDDLIAEYDGSGAVLNRYVHGPEDDEPVAWYAGSGTGSVKYLTQDERGSVVAVSDSATTVFSYDPYGRPGSTNTGRFQFTGQTWVPEAGLYNYKARFYDPWLGRFLTPDPSGYAAGDMNLYAYVGDDPVNGRDPTGLQAVSTLTVNACPRGTQATSAGCISTSTLDEISAQMRDAVEEWLNNSIRDTSQCGYFADACLAAQESVDQSKSLQLSTTFTPIPSPQGATILEQRGKRMSQKAQEAAAEADNRICRMVKTRECWASAAERRAARAAGRPVPPLQTGVKENWYGRNTATALGAAPPAATGAAATTTAGGLMLLCIALEPCGVISALNQ